MAEGGKGPLVFKLLLIGDGGVGKTTFVTRHRLGYFEKKYEATQGFKVYPLVFNSTRGEILFEVFDTSGQEKSSQFSREKYEDARCGIVMYDVSSMITFKNVANWYKDLDETCKGIPIVIVANKVDRKDRKVALKQVKFHREDHVEISAKANLNLEQPFLKLARKLVGDEALEFIEVPAVHPPEVVLTAELKEKFARDMKIAEEAPLPEDDDDL